MQIRTKFTLCALALHRCHDFAIDYQAANIRATRFLDEFLDQDVCLDPHKTLDDAFCGFLGFGEHYADSLGTL